jgi:hypothetical protein
MRPNIWNRKHAALRVTCDVACGLPHVASSATWLGDSKSIGPALTVQQFQEASEPTATRRGEFIGR